MRPTIALDADGILLNYHQTYQLAWQRAFDVLPALRDPMAYWPIDLWDVRRLSGDELDQFRRCFDYQFWVNRHSIQHIVCINAYSYIFRRNRCIKQLLNHWS